jgi:GTPase
MTFIDQAKVRVKAGDGGNGCVAFRREKFVPKGGPSGGDGGEGGSVFVRASSRLNTLYHLQFQREWKGGRGEHGMGSNCSGRKGEDVIIELPVGTVVRDAETGDVLADLSQDGETLLVAAGGRGGLGNQHFATSRRQTPRHATPGVEGEERTLEIELKLIADVGLVGFPNAGKSTLISVVSAAKPKIADYPFTTLVPNLGVVTVDIEKTFVVADIPGLIEGAHEGHGLGDRFLKHVERCSVLVHLVDLSQTENPSADAKIIEKELEAYSPLLASKRRLICGSKLDSAVEGATEDLRGYAESRGEEFIAISAVVGTNVRELVERLSRVIDDEKEAQRLENRIVSLENP